MSETIDEYILAHIDKESDYMHRLWRATQLHLLFARTTVEDAGGDGASEVGVGNWHL